MSRGVLPQLQCQAIAPSRCYAGRLAFPEDCSKGLGSQWVLEVLWEKSQICLPNYTSSWSKFKFYHLEYDSSVLLICACMVMSGLNDKGSLSVGARSAKFHDVATESSGEMLVASHR